MLHKITYFNPLPPSDAVRKEKKILEDLFSSVLSEFKKYHPFGNLDFDNFGIFRNLKLRILMGKILPISVNLNYPPNTLGCYGLIRVRVLHLMHMPIAKLAKSAKLPKNPLNNPSPKPFA